MQRREWLRGLGAVVGVGLSGCVQTPGRDSPFGLPERRLLEYGEYGRFEGIRATTLNLRRFDFVKYRHPANGTERVWNPGPDHELAIARFAAEKLENAGDQWPAPSDFHLQTGGEVLPPTENTPEGTDPSGITWPAGALFPPEDSGPVLPAFRHEWKSVYLFDATIQTRLTMIWVYPEDPIFWIAPG